MLAAAAFAGCDPQADDEYRGEPLATLEGSIQVAEDTSPGDDLVAATLWHVWDEEDSTSVNDHVEVGGEFPAAFHLELFAPPPERALFDLSEETDGQTSARVATGYVAVLPESAMSLGDMPSLMDAAAGWENEHVLVYADAAVPPEALEGIFPGGLEAGYQLFRAVHVEGDFEAHEACVAPYDECVAECGDDDVTCFDACWETHDISDCPRLDDHDLLEPVPIDEELVIVIGGEKKVPDWF